MATVKPERRQAFAIWITGLPASGKSTIAKALRANLAGRGVDVAVLESDELRKVFTPHPHYDEQEREMFYNQLVYVGALLVSHGVPVIFDATATRGDWRDRARRAITRFIEVFVDTPLEVCIERDPKGIYAQARQGNNTFVPGLQTDYERPVNPDVVVRGDSETPEAAAARILARLVEKDFVGP
jgi:adenylylsulfate kinase